MNKEIFGQFLAQTRKEQGMTQQDLAQQLHVTNTAVSKWERGLSYPDVSLFEPLAQVLGLSISELMACQKNAISPDDPRERSVRSLLDIVRESSRRQRRIWTLVAVLLLTALLITGGLLYYFTVLSVYGTAVARIPVKQADEDGCWLFLEKGDGLLKLKCEDPTLYDSILAGWNAYYRLEYRYNKNTWEGQLLSCVQPDPYLFIGTPMAEKGSIIDIGSLLGAENVWNEVVFVRKDPLRDGGYLHSYRFYTQDLPDPAAERTLVNLTDCRGFTLQDYDSDGITELFVLTHYKNQTFQIYDLENGKITSRFTDKVPEDIAAFLLEHPLIA